MASLPLEKIYQEAKKLAACRYANIPPGKLRFFPDRGWCDIWLESRLQAPKEWPWPKAVLVLQDWGDEGDIESEPDSVGWLVETLRGEKKPDDATVRNLWIAYRKQITDGTLLVMNAVWGLRPKGSRCGYLGDSIHSNAFPVWHYFLQELNVARIYIGGSWAKWSDQRFEKEIGADDYFQRWADWAKVEVDDWPFDAHVTLLPHPCTWNFPAPTIIF